MKRERFGPLVSGDELASELRRRKKREIFETVTGSSRYQIEQKVKLKEENGWRVVRKNINSTRIAKTKPAEERLEDEIWSILAQMGFKVMSSGRDFLIEVRGQEPILSISIFAKDDEAALVVFCTRREPSALIDEISTIRTRVVRSISNAFGGPTKLKVKFVIASRCVSWSKENLTNSESAQISVVTDEELDYYAVLTQHLKQAARYQLLGHLLSGQKVEGLTRQVVATRGKMGGETFYAFLIQPDELLKIAYVGHKASRKVEDLETYQRMLQPHRLRKIAEYINDGGRFPTNIVVNLKPIRRHGLRFDSKEKFGNEAFGVLHLPRTYGAAWIIDGQHRLYGYAYARELETFKDDASVVSVLAYENLSADKEMNMFIDINSKQVKVSSGLLIELFAELHWKSPDLEKAFQAQLSRIASSLNEDSTSPLHERIVVTGKRKSRIRCLTQTSIHAGLEVSKLLGTVSSGKIVAGPLSTADPTDFTENVRKGVEVLKRCLEIYAVQVKALWELGDGPGGYLCTNNGIRALFHVIKDITDHISLTQDLNLCEFSVEELFAEVKPYLNTLADFFSKASDQEIIAFRLVGSSLAAVRQQALKMEAQIQKLHHDFMPHGLAEYLESRDEAGTEEALQKVLEIQKRLFSYVTSQLKKTFGTEKKAWWVEGVPVKIRADCSKRWEEKNRVGAEENQLYLQHYADICVQNWDLMKSVISLDAKDKENRKKNTKWIRVLYDIRNWVAHPEHGVLDSAQVEKVREIYDKVEKYFPFNVAQSFDENID